MESVPRWFRQQVRKREWPSHELQPPRPSRQVRRHGLHPCAGNKGRSRVTSMGARDEPK